MNLNVLTSKRRPSQETPPPRSAERQALAEAIERRNEIQREFDATDRALNEVQEKRRGGDARRAVETAKQAVETAKANAAAFATATVLGTAGEPPVSIKAARAALQDAEDDLETQRTVEDGLKASKEAIEGSLRWAREKVKDKLAAVVAADPAFRQLFADYENWRRSMAQRAQLLSFLFPQTPRELESWQFIRQYRPEELEDETPPWRAVLAELEHNSEAPLPTA